MSLFATKAKWLQSHRIEAKNRLIVTLEWSCRFLDIQPTIPSNFLIHKQRAYLLPKDKAFSDKIFNEFVPPNVAIECVTREFIIALNVYQQPTLAVLGTGASTVKATCIANEMPGRGKHVGEPLRSSRAASTARSLLPVVFSIFIIIFVVIAVVVISVIHVVVGIDFFGGGIDSIASKGRRGELLLNHRIHHSHWHIGMSHQPSVWSLVHQSHGLGGVWSTNVVLGCAHSRSSSEASSRRRSATATTTLVFHKETNGSFKVSTTHFEIHTGPFRIRAPRERHELRDHFIAGRHFDGLLMGVML